MSRDEIERNLGPEGVLDHLGNPCGLRGGRTPNPQTPVCALDGPGRTIIELKVGGLLWLSSPKIDVRLVPNLEIPLRHLIDAIAIHQMLCEVVNQFLPLRIVFWRRR